MFALSVLRVAAAGLALMASVSVYAAESAYPNKPIRLIVPFPPGGSADPLARAIGAWYSEKLGVPVISDNRPGAGTAIAHTLGAKAAPDGYTLLLSASSGMAANPALGAKLDYDPIKDFAPVGLAAYVPQVFVVHPSVPAKNMAELVELAKSRPDTISFGTPGVGSLGHLSVALISAMTSAKFVHVPYKGAGPAVIDLISNRIQAFIGSVTGTQAQIAAGKIRGLAVGHLQRVRALPDVPTVAESLPGFSNNGWYGVVGPVGTPSAVINKLNAELQRALAESEFTKHIETLGMVPAGGTPDTLRAWIASELTRWTKVVRDAGIQLR
jgi:tripartite-type tricarboxylate transporter receptor subunit TctC